MSASTPNNRSKSDDVRSKHSPSFAHASASVILVSPSNEILLLHRVHTSSSFPSAHVFPGGNLSEEQDGTNFPGEDLIRHEDGRAYRLAATRETFEESGILLAKRDDGTGLWSIPDEDRETGRKAIHSGQIKFLDWLEAGGGVADLDNLIPFTRWITPTNLPKRYTTQMYIYFLPLGTTPLSASGPLSTDEEAIIPNPTSDGGIEHTSARFLPAHEWLSLARSGSIILFPPQYVLLHLLEPMLAPPNSTPAPSLKQLQQQREDAMRFLSTGDPPWGEMCISPYVLSFDKETGEAVLGLDRPGAELEGTGRRGDGERVVLVKMEKQGPRVLDVRSRGDFLKKGGKARGGKL